jgi:hypothetical protein
LDVELLAVMKEILTLDSLACQESALHGLSHWRHHYSRFVEGPSTISWPASGPFGPSFDDMPRLLGGAMSCRLVICP